MPKPKALLLTYKTGYVAASMVTDTHILTEQ